MSTLEEAFRKAAADGRLDKLSIMKDPDGRGWQVNTPSRFGQNAWAVEIRPDVVDALLAALTPITAAEVGIAVLSGRDMEE